MDNLNYQSTDVHTKSQGNALSPNSDYQKGMLNSTGVSEHGNHQALRLNTKKVLTDDDNTDSVTSTSHNAAEDYAHMSRSARYNATTQSSAPNWRQMDYTEADREINQQLKAWENDAVSPISG